MKRILVSARFQPQIQSWAERLRRRSCWSETAEPPLPSTAPPPAEVDLRRHLAAIMFTSGSTGEVKGVMVTHHNILVNTEDILGYTGIGADDRVMTVLPFYYCYGTSLLHTHLMAGGVAGRQQPLHVSRKSARRDGGEALHGFGRRSRNLPDPAPQDAIRPAAGFRRCAGCNRRAEGCPIRCSARFAEALPEVRLFVMYGQTEATARLSYLPPERLDDKLGSIGRGLPHTRLEVLRPDGTPVRRARTKSARSWPPARTSRLGYWGDAEETGRYFRDGKLYTGDMARIDADGFIFIVERARDFIKAMGYRVGAERGRGSAGRNARDRGGGRHRRPRRIVGRGDPGVRRHRPAGPT